MSWKIPGICILIKYRKKATSPQYIECRNQLLYWAETRTKGFRSKVSFTHNTRSTQGKEIRINFSPHKFSKFTFGRMSFWPRWSEISNFLNMLKEPSIKVSLSSFTDFETPSSRFSALFLYLTTRKSRFYRTPFSHPKRTGFMDDFKFVNGFLKVGIIFR